MSAKLKNKVAVVTGASKGIGAAIAKHLAAEGASVVVNYSTSKAGADRVVDEIVKKGGKAIAVQANVSKLPDIQKLIAQTVKTYGKLDILVNNAGVYEFTPLENITAEFYHRMFDLNVLGLILTSKEAVNHFGPSGGSIINISSLASVLAVPEASVYSATKAAVDTITRSLSMELGPRKIRVNAVNPGVVATEGTSELIQGDFLKEAVDRTPLGRVGQPTDIAPVVAFLASDDAAWITGETIFVSGGLR